MECSINYGVHHDLQINVTKEKKDSKSKGDIEEEKNVGKLVLQVHLTHLWVSDEHGK